MPNDILVTSEWLNVSILRSLISKAICSFCAKFECKLSQYINSFRSLCQKAVVGTFVCVYLILATESDQGQSECLFPEDLWHRERTHLLVHILVQKEDLKQWAIQCLIVLNNRYQLFFGAHWSTKLSCSKNAGKKKKWSQNGLQKSPCLKDLLSNSMTEKSPVQVTKLFLDSG